MSDDGRNGAAKKAPRRPALPLDSSVFFKLVRVVNMTARPFSESIGQGEDLRDLQEQITEAVAVHFDEGEGPRRIRVHFVSDPILVQV